MLSGRNEYISQIVFVNKIYFFMKNELENLEGLFISLIEGSVLEAELFSTAWPEEKDRFLRAVMKNVLQLQSERQICYYVRWYQDRIVRLADNVFLGLEESEIQDGEPLQLLFDLLDEFSLAFKNDFDLSGSIPIGLHTKECAVLTPVAGELEALLEAEGISDDLIQIALIPIGELIKSETNPFSFHELYYVRHYTNGLSSIGAEIGSRKNKDFALAEILIGLNFNNPQFFQYLINSISQKERGDARNSREGLAYMKDYRKRINQIFIPKGICYAKAIPSIKKQLLSWLNEEIKLLQAKSSNPEEVEPYLKLNLSVSQIAYLTSLFYKHDVFHEPVKAKVIRGITQTFSSRETTRISPGSFKTKAQEPGDNAVEEVRKLLKAMVKDTENYLG